MLKLLLPTFLLLTSACTCTREESEPAAAPAPQAGVEAAAPDAAAEPAWDPAALALAEQLAEKLRAAGMLCEEYEVIPAGAYLPDYQKQLRLSRDRLPLAESYCTSEDDEDITFIVFTNQEHAKNFIAIKQRLLCRRAKEMKLDNFPGFPYVLGDRWVIQPDERTTSVRIADILGAEAAMAGCESDGSDKSDASDGSDESDGSDA